MNWLLWFGIALMLSAPLSVIVRKWYFNKIDEAMAQGVRLGKALGCLPDSVVADLIREAHQHAADEREKRNP